MISNKFLVHSKSSAKQGLILDIVGKAFADKAGDIDTQKLDNGMANIAENRGKLMVLAAFVLILLKIWFA